MKYCKSTCDMYLARLIQHCRWRLHGIALILEMSFCWTLERLSSNGMDQKATDRRGSRYVFDWSNILRVTPTYIQSIHKSKL